MVKVMNLKTNNIIEVPEDHWNGVLAHQGKYVLVTTGDLGQPVHLEVTVEEKDGQLIQKDIKVKGGKHVPTVSK